MSNKDQFNKKRPKIISDAKTQLDGLIANKKQQVADISKKIEDGVQQVENSAVEIEKNLLQKQKTAKDKNIDFSQELVRKTVHFTSLSIPITYIFLDRELMLLLLIPLMFLFVTSDIITKRVAFLRAWYLKAFGAMLRKHEIKTKKIFLNGASWVLIAAVLTVFIFPKIIAIVALSVLILADVFAALIGRKYGKTRFLGLKKKTREGTLAFFIVSLIVTVVYGLIFNLPFIYYFSGIFASAIAAIGEALSKKVLRTDDNLVIPISFGITMWFVEAVFRYFS